MGFGGVLVMLSCLIVLVSSHWISPVSVCLNQWQPGDVSGGSNVKIQFTSGEQFCSDASGQQPHDGVSFLMSDMEMRPTWFSKSSVSLMIRAFLTAADY